MRNPDLRSSCVLFPRSMVWTKHCSPIRSVLSQGSHDSNTMQAALNYLSTDLCTHDLVKFLPHMKARHPLHTLLVLRATCRQMIPPCVSAMAHRIDFLRRLSRHRQIMLSVQQTSQLSRIMDSGFLFQSWLPSLPGTNKWRHKLKRKTLLFDGGTYRPLGMTHEYWVELRERCGQCVANMGCIDDENRTGCRGLPSRGSISQSEVSSFHQRIR